MHLFLTLLTFNLFISLPSSQLFSIRLGSSHFSSTRPVFSNPVEVTSKKLSLAILVTARSNFKAGWIATAGHHFEATSRWKSSKRLTCSGGGLPPVPGRPDGPTFFSKTNRTDLSPLCHEQLPSPHSISYGLKITTSIRDWFLIWTQHLHSNPQVKFLSASMFFVSMFWPH